MSNPNVRPSDRAVPIAFVAPISLSGAASSTGWVDMGNFDSIEATIILGVTASGGTIDAKLEQATSSAGAGVKDITGKALAQITAAGGSAGPRAAVINCRADQLDVENGFRYARLTITAATAASLATGIIHGHDARYQPADDATTVLQVVG